MPANPPTRGELGPDIVHSANGFLESLVPNPRTTTQIRAWSVGYRVVLRPLQPALPGK